MAKPLEINDSTYQAEVIDADKPVLVDFWAPWCGPCRMVGPILEEIAAEQESKIKIVKVNVDENQQYASQLGVFNIPTMILYKGGQPVDKIVGALPKNQLMDRLSPFFDQDSEKVDAVIAL
ncbi:MAG: thioredoxin [Chloroflexota bacterium]|nr:thioredoxin [Chloroflexia bacterium]MDQ3442565.1 thioredoxin [Chloroflexota bacterium]